jgi:Protein of unknown function (DUF3467)
LGVSEAGRRRPVEGRSANHFEMAFTESEFLLDFGQAYGTSKDALLHTRIIMTPIAAKTLSRMLARLIDQYESDMGAITERTS